VDELLQYDPARLPSEHLDPLTGLPNQAFLEQALREALGDGRPTTVALLQLENFHEIRSWLGRSDASFLFCDIARLLASSLPAGVVPCRCEHHEFALLLRNAHSVNARPITDRIRQALRSAASESIPRQLELRFAVGLALAEPGGTSPEVLFARARQQLGTALLRRHGEGRLAAMHEIDGFDPAGLGPALERNPLALSFQPIVRLVPDGIERYEMRCHLPLDKGRLAPARMFEIAVQNALGGVIDRQMIEQALRILRESGTAELCLFVSLTQNSLVDGNFSRWLQIELDGLPHVAEQLVFQIGEIDVLVTQHHLPHFCEQLARLGIRLAIGNFGLSGNPLRYLPLLNADFVNIDVSNAGNSGAGRHQLLQSLQGIRDANLQVIASSVEDFATLPLLWRDGVALVQGGCLAEADTSLAYDFPQDRRISAS